MVTSDNDSAAREGGAADAVLDIAFAVWRATLLLRADELDVVAARGRGPGVGTTDGR